MLISECVEILTTCFLGFLNNFQGYQLLLQIRDSDLIFLKPALKPQLFQVRIPGISLKEPFVMVLVIFLSAWEIIFFGEVIGRPGLYFKSLEP